MRNYVSKTKTDPLSSWGVSQVDGEDAFNRKIK